MLIIKYFEQFALKVPGAPDTYPRWGKVTAKKDQQGNKTIKLKPITRDEAMETIRERGLVEVLRTKDGIVYDTRDGAFKKKARGYYVPSTL